MRLAKDGIFPIVKDKDGHLLPDLPASGFQFAGRRKIVRYPFSICQIGRM